MKNFFSGFEKEAAKDEDRKVSPGMAATVAGSGTATGILGKEMLDTHRIQKKLKAAPKMTTKDFESMYRPGDIILTRDPSKIHAGDVLGDVIGKKVDIKPAVAALGGTPYAHSEVVGYTRGKKGRGRKKTVVSATSAGERSSFLRKGETIGGRAGGVLLRPKSKAQAERAAKRGPALARRPYGGVSEAGEYTARNILGAEGSKGGFCRLSPGGKLVCHQLTSAAHSEVLPQHASPKSMLKSKEFDVVATKGRIPGALHSGYMARPLVRAGIYGGLAAGAGYGLAKALNLVSSSAKEKEKASKKLSP